MAHLRERYLLPILKKDITWSPVVSLLGMRQVGKTTLLKSIGKSYFSLDDDAILREFELGHWGLLGTANQPIVVDEAQKNPGLFDRIKLIVDKQKKPAQFLLTGSVRFLSKKNIRESLTGRTSLLQLLPLTLAEAHSKKQSCFLKMVMENQKIKSIEKLSDAQQFRDSASSHYLQTGGLPGICFKRDLALQNRMREELLETQLMRDLQSLVKTKVPYAKLKMLLKGLAQNQGMGISVSALARSVQVSTPTATQILQAMEGLFLIRSHGKEIYLSDCGLASYLGADRIDNELFQMERFVYQELYSQLNYQYQAQYSLEPYLSRGGARIPFVIHFQQGIQLAIAVDPTSGASEKSLKSLTWFSKSKSPHKVISVVLHRGSNAYMSSTGAMCLPYYWVS